MAGLNIVEKVIALEGVELLKNLTPEQLSRIASIAREVKHPPNKVILDPSIPMDALLVVVDGSVELSRDGEVLHTAVQNDVLGAWALFDNDPCRLRQRRWRTRACSESDGMIFTICSQTTSRLPRQFFRRW